jgi:hypothetical protein
MSRCATMAAFVATLALALPLSAAAQLQRPFPRDALRGEIQFVQPPQVLLNGKPAQLSPGARVRAPNNTLVMAPMLAGSKGVVHYVTEAGGLISAVWLLTPEEFAVKPWPATPAEAAAWTWDPGSHSWMKP